jgi:hypothetical protein
MKCFGVLVALLLVGCASGPTLEELEDAALVSGDWTAVEEREQALQRRGRHHRIDCSAGYVGVCIEHASTSRCQCVRAVSMGRFP